METDTQDSRDSVREVRESVAARIEELGKRFESFKHRADLRAHIANHPFVAVGVAFACGALARGIRPKADRGTERGVGAAVIGALGAFAYAAIKNYAFRELSTMAKSWLDQRDRPAAAQEQPAGRSESSLRH